MLSAIIAQSITSAALSLPFGFHLRNERIPRKSARFVSARVGGFEFLRPTIEAMGKLQQLDTSRVVQRQAIG